MRKIGFTGTQRGMTPEQTQNLAKFLKEHLLDSGPAAEFHVGDCIGADAEATTLAKSLGLKTIGHPPKEEKKRAWLVYDEFRAPKHYLDRNWDIANESEVLIATPKGPEVLHSGTWATVRYARKMERPIVIIYPDGSIKTESGWVTSELV